MMKFTTKQTTQQEEKWFLEIEIDGTADISTLQAALTMYTSHMMKQENRTKYNQDGTEKACEWLRELQEVKADIFNR